MIALPKINGFAGIVLRGIGAMITGPAKIDHIKTDINEIKADVKSLAGEVRETKGYIKGHVEGHSHREGA